MTFIQALDKKLIKTKTENGANALVTSQSALVDFFGLAGALRKRGKIEIENLFSRAFAEDPHLAMKLLFYTRDIRGGLGERRTARIIYKHLSRVSPESLRANLKLMSHYGRWDDLLVLLNTSLQDDILDLIGQQLAKDLREENPSLLAKWLPSMNTSSPKTRKDAATIATGLSFDAKKYRQTLSELRKRIDVLEVKMSAKEWETIDYERVPSNAMNNYSRSFFKHDEDRFKGYIEAVKEGRADIHARVLYPYNITEKMLYDRKLFKSGDEASILSELEILEEQWYRLPDYVDDSNRNVLVMADVSGSMTGRPMATSIGLALYFAEKTNGEFKNTFMTFSESPALVKVTGKTLYEKVRMVLSSNWGMNTDFEKALYTILQTAKVNRMKQSDLPETLIVITDMQFDASIQSTNKDWTFYLKMKKMYQAEGYKMPEIVFWNVNSRSNVFQVSHDYEGVKMASGQSTSVFKSILESKAMTAYDYMMEVLSGERYKEVS